MARPTKIQQFKAGVSRTAINAYQDLVNAVDADGRENLRVCEMVFANLVAQEGYTYTDAYEEAFKTGTDNHNSIKQMASRMAGKPRIKAEIERIQKRLEEDKLENDNRLGIALDGARLRDRMALELFAIATSPSVTSARDKMQAWKMLGDMKHVQAWVNGTTKVDDSLTVEFGESSSASEARSQVVDRLKATLSRRLAGATININATREPEAGTIPITPEQA